MNTLGSLYKDLANGELSNLAIAKDTEQGIVSAARPKIILYANDALYRLYSRFVLKQNDLVIQQVENITFYHLIRKYSESYYVETNGESTPIPYIKDLLREPFQGDVIKILSIFDSFGQNRPLNDSERADSYFTPQGDILQIPSPQTGMGVGILYQAKHPPLEGDLDTPIELPLVLYSAFTAYIAYKVFSHMNTPEASAKAQEHLQIYTKLCDDVVENDLVNNSISITNAKFTSRGWI